MDIKRIEAWMEYVHQLAFKGTKREGFFPAFKDQAEVFDTVDIVRSKELRDNYLLRPRYCFYNCQMTVLETHYNYQYYEGYALNSIGLPIHHAWLVGDGSVIDPTWEEPGQIYYGIHIPREYIRKVILEEEFARDLMFDYLLQEV